jgi:hypothetical protein
VAELAAVQAGLGLVETITLLAVVLLMAAAVALLAQMEMGATAQLYWDYQHTTEARVFFPALAGGWVAGLVALLLAMERL